MFPADEGGNAFRKAQVTQASILTNDHPRQILTAPFEVNLFSKEVAAEHNTGDPGSFHV